jgi:EAL domain-containing protein (putative c-di-GMP-specific phosphodiesterase class I)/DNA-binding response OmpR family regulator
VTAWREQPRIVVVDDQDANRRLLEQILVRAGFGDVRSYASGAEFLGAFPADDPDLVLLDLHMPALDGYEVLDAIRGRQHEGTYLPVLVLTADVERSARSRALAGGANDFLVKPFDADEVVLRVRNLIETRRLHESLRAKNSELVAEIAVTTERLAATEAEWAKVGAALSRLDVLESPEATATAICNELRRLPDLETVGVFGFAGGGAMVPFALQGALASRLEVDRPVPEGWSRAFGRLMRDGPWLGSIGALAEALALPELLDEDVTAVALVPLGREGDPIGVLAAATRGTDGIVRLGRHIAALEAFAAVSGALLGTVITTRRRVEDARAKLAEVIRQRAFRPVFQPVVNIGSGRVVGFEALTRFSDGARPDHRFSDADAVGLGIDLEAVCLEAAIEAGGALPEGTWLSLNVSPGFALAGPRLQEILRSKRRQLVIELTEHVPVEDYAALREAVSTLGPTVRYAIDDAGAGFASFRHILELRPHFVKLDIGLVRGIERDPARQAFVAGLVYFALETESVLIAEGIETEPERKQLAQLAVGLGQGYLLGRPADAPATRPRRIGLRRQTRRRARL